MLAIEYTSSKYSTYCVSLACKGRPLSLFTKGRWAEVCDKRHVRSLTRRFVTISTLSVVNSC